MKHLVTIDASLLNSVGVAAEVSPLSIFRVEPISGDTGYRVLQPAGLGFEDIECSGDPLHVQEAWSFPPFEALCLYGGAPVSSWLKHLRLERFEYYAAGTEAVAREYEAEFVRRSPIHNGAADVVLGGWHQMWPEDDFYLPLEMRLAMLTLRDAEPWVALWLANGSGNWSIREHIT